MRGATKDVAKRSLYVRVSPATRAELDELVKSGARGSTLSAVTSRTLEDGLRYDEVAVMSLLSWCWRVVGHLNRGGDELGPEFEKAIRRCEAQLRIRRG